MKLDLTILIVHYNRINCLTKSLERLHAIFGNSVEYLIADDCTPEHKLKSLLKDYDVRLARLSTNCGLGANINNALKKINTKYVLQIQDDHYLKEGINRSFLENAIECLEQNSDIDMLRFLLPYDLNIKEYRLSGNLELCIISNNIFKNMPYPFYVYSDWPHLRKYKSYKKFGNYEENQPVGVTELAYGMNFIVKQGKIGYINKYRNIFEHDSIGLTYNKPRFKNNNIIPKIKYLWLIKSYIAYYYMKITGRFPFRLY